MARSKVSIEENKKPVTPFARPVKEPTTSPRRKPQSTSGEEENLVEPNLLELVPVDIFEKSTIKLDRQIYSRKGFNQVVGTEFEELQKKEDTFSPEQFYQLYNSLFFDIPKTGDISHANIAKRSKEYIQGVRALDPKDAIIDTLNDKVLELEQALLLANQADPEHPFFKNGSLVAEAVNGVRTGKFYYMDKGYKREVAYNNTFFGTLLNVLGYDSSNPDYPDASKTLLSQIKTGPILSEGNFEQTTSIEDGELIIGSNVTNDTKDATIAQLRSQVNDLTQRVEELQDELTDITNGPTNQGDNNDDGGALNNPPVFGGQFGPNFNNPFN